MDSQGVPFDVARLEHRVTVLEAKLGHLPDDVREMRKDIQALTMAVQNRVQQPATTALDSVALAIQRMMDQQPRQQQQPNRMMYVLLGAAALAIGLYLFKVPMP